MTVMTGVDLPAGSPGGSVELLKDLYLRPGHPIAADVFMLASGTATSAKAADRGEPGPADGATLLRVHGKQLDGHGFWTYVADLSVAISREFTPDGCAVVHLQHLAFGATPALLRAFPRHPHIALVHGTDLLCAAAHPTQRDVLNEAVHAARAVVVPTVAMADHLRRLSVREPRRLAHIPWGIPDSLFPPRRQPRGRDDGEFRVLFAGRLSAEKGAAALIGELAGLAGITLSVAAPPGEFGELSRQVDVCGVHYLGWLDRPRLWDAFAEHDLLIVSSTTLEAFGLVAVEAQACGLPVLYRPVPGLIEVLGQSAARVGGSPGTFAAAVRDLSRDPGALRDLRDAGWRNAARFPLSRTACDLAALTGEVLA